MDEEKNLSEDELIALIEEHRAEERAGWERDFGPAGAADLEAGRAEAFRFQADALGPEPAPGQKVSAAEINNIVSELERGWQQPYEAMLRDASERAAHRTHEREPER